MIKNREKLKCKLQSKANKSKKWNWFIIIGELTPEDKEKFKISTKEVEKNIRTFKQTNLMNIVWKGLYYEWVSKFINKSLIL